MDTKVSILWVFEIQEKLRHITAITAASDDPLLLLLLLFFVQTWEKVRYGSKYK